jgi:hypothetical protein
VSPAAKQSEKMMRKTSFIGMTQLAHKRGQKQPLRELSCSSVDARGFCAHTLAVSFGRINALNMTLRLLEAAESIQMKQK